MTFRNCIAQDAASANNSGFTVTRGGDGLCVIENCAALNVYNAFTQSGAGDGAMRVVNCTSTGAFRSVYQSGGASPTWDLVNNLFLGSTYNLNNSATSATFTGSNNFGGTTASSTHQLPVAIQGSPYPVTAHDQTHPTPVSYTHLKLPTNREV